MVSSIKDLKARMQRAETIDAIKGIAKQSYPVDERYWQPTLDKEGNAKAVIRFLPTPPDEKLDFVKYYSHWIEGNGSKYIEKCLTTLNQKDPAEEHARKVGAEDKKLYGRFGRMVRFVTNILVVHEPNKPENNGKVFLFDFGNSIMKKIQKAMTEDEDPIDPKPAINVFCPWNGANFKVVVTKKGGYKNYDDSTFLKQSALFEGDDSKIEALWQTEHKLEPEVDASKFKTYAELESLLSRVLDNTSSQRGAAGSSSASVAVSPRSAAALQATSKREDSPAEHDPDAVFNELLKGTESLSSDDAVESLFDE